MVKQVTVRDDAGTIKRSTVAFGEYANIENAKDILSVLIMQAGGSLTAYDSTNRLGSAMSKSGIVASEPAAVTALRFYTEFADPSKVYYSWNRSLPNSQQAFAQGNLALYIGYASELPQIQSENPNLNFAVARLPQIKNASHTVDIARVYGLAVSHTSHNIAGAQNVVATLVSAVNSAAYATAFNLSSARRDVLSQASTGNQSLFNAATISAYSWTDPNSSATATLFQSMIEDTTSGTIMVGDAVGRADAQMTQIINNNH
jgi:maltose-binding protein MalE